MTLTQKLCSVFIFHLYIFNDSVSNIDSCLNVDVFRFFTRPAFEIQLKQTYMRIFSIKILNV